MPVQDFVVQAEEAPVTVAVEPAHHALHSLLLLVKHEQLSGLGEWVSRTASAWQPAEHRHHELVIIGFFHAITPHESWPSFPAYVDHLAALDPRDLRAKVMDFYASLPCRDESAVPPCEGGPHLEPVDPPADWSAALQDVDSYLDFLRARFDPAHIDVELETQAYAYLVDPPAMQDLIVGHLRRMWDQCLADEWARVEPMLQDSARAFRQIDMSRMGRREAARFVAGPELDREKWDWVFERAERIVLIPSAHVGPYLGTFWTGTTRWILFGARLPEGAQFHAPDLSRSEIVVRLGALADDNRLQILQQIAGGGELSSQEIMTGLGFSQSATSRHLKQLSATGYLLERRCNGAKCYRLDPERVEDTLRAVSSFLLGK